MAITPFLSKLMSITIDSSTIGCAQDFSWSINRDTLEIACLGGSGAKTFIPDNHTWSASGSGMALYTKDLTTGTYQVYDIARNIQTDASIFVQLLPDASTQDYFEGVGYFTSVSFEGGVGSPVSYSFEIQGTGDYTIGQTD
jgi:hypothetical protein